MLVPLATKIFRFGETDKSTDRDRSRAEIDVLFEIERGINGLEPDKRVAARQDESKPLCDDLRAWLITKRDLVSVKSEIAKAINYGLS